MYKVAKLYSAPVFPDLSRKGPIRFLSLTVRGMKGSIDYMLLVQPGFHLFLEPFTHCFGEGRDSGSVTAARFHQIQYIGFPRVRDGCRTKGVTLAVYEKLGQRRLLYKIPVQTVQGPVKARFVEIGKEEFFEIASGIF